MITPAAVDGVGHSTARRTRYTRLLKPCINLNGIYLDPQLDVFSHSSTIVSSDGHIVRIVIGDNDLCRGGLHGDW